MDRLDLVATVLPAKLEKTGKCRVASGKWLLGGSCQKIARHSRSREAPEYHIGEAKASGNMCRRYDYGTTAARLQQNQNTRFSLSCRGSREAGLPAVRHWLREVNALTSVMASFAYASAAS